VNVHLSDVEWSDALEVILKPYGYGYTTTGKAIVVNRLDKIAAVKAVEPLESKVFTLKYLDASDIKDTIEKHLSLRGNMSVLHSKGLVGWKTADAARASSRSGGNTLGKRERDDAATEELQKSKIFIVTDIPSVLKSVASILAEVDLEPKQVLIEAKFLEVSASYLQDVGVDFSRVDLGDITLSSELSAVAPNAFNAAAELSGGAGRSVFGQLKLDSSDADAFLRVLQEDDSSNLLSAPKIMTLNNQEATIVVGTKFPIIESDTTGSGTSVTSTSLEYYENIGIQLNVVPQVCDNNQINMIVHPSVSEKEGTTTGISGGGSATVTEYPIISIREVETQILLNNDQTVVIGGLMVQRGGKSSFKIPLLGDVPYLGRLFRRDVDSTENIELLIFLKATIIDQGKYAATSLDEQNALNGKMLASQKKEVGSMACSACTPDQACTMCAPPVEAPAAQDMIEVDTPSVEPMEMPQPQVIEINVQDDAPSSQAPETDSAKKELSEDEAIAAWLLSV
jgi:general secretion pathway protein D